MCACRYGRKRMERGRKRREQHERKLVVAAEGAPRWNKESDPVEHK